MEKYFLGKLKKIECCDINNSVDFKWIYTFEICDTQTIDEKKFGLVDVRQNGGTSTSNIELVEGAELSCEVDYNSKTSHCTKINSLVSFMNDRLNEKMTVCYVVDRDTTEKGKSTNDENSDTTNNGNNYVTVKGKSKNGTRKILRSVCQK